jgi:pimeloyl-ACP methyl ester carboxylesterase
VDWWEQPTVDSGAGSWTEATVAAIRQRIAELADSAGRPIAVVAHSFGALLAQRVLSESADGVRSLCLLAPGVSLVDQYLRVGEHFSARSDTVREAVGRLRSAPGLQSLCEVLGSIGALPDWEKAYFSPRNQEAFARFRSLAPDGIPFDFATFSAGAGEVMAEPPSPIASGFSGPVRMVVGSDDILLDGANLMGYWSGVFGQLTVDEVEAGHMIHLELPPSRWLPA